MRTGVSLRKKVGPLPVSYGQSLEVNLVLPTLHATFTVKYASAQVGFKCSLQILWVYFEYFHSKS